MNKSILTEAIAAQHSITKKAAGEIIDLVFDSIIEAVKSGDGATFPGFGSFSSSKREARVGRNPQTGEEIKIAASIVPKFKPGTKFKEAVNTKPSKKKK